MRPRKPILLADDVESSLEIRKFVLETRGHFQVLTARNVHALFELLNTIRIDVVLLSFSSREIDCNAIVEDIKRQWPETRVIVHGAGLAGYDCRANMAELMLPGDGQEALIQNVKLLAARKRGPKHKHQEAMA